jgi:anthranilate synthase component I
MTHDPWERFVHEGGAQEIAGYFETAERDGRPGRAAWFTSADDLLTLTPRADPSQTGGRIERFLRGHPRGAVVGYLGFDAVGLFEPALRSFPSGSPFPLGELALVPSPRTSPVRFSRRRRLARTPVGRPVHDSLPRERFERSVRRVVEDVRAGEAFQVVLAHRRSWRRPDALIDRAGRLRAAERFSSFYYLRFGDRELVGATPESVAEVERSRAFVDPIAGTIPRGPRRGRRPLARDPKELCEHRMLVDLARNDLGRVARAGTVRLDWTERLVRYARLEHLVSRVAAQLRPGVAPWDVLAATFPAGTVSGAPKIRATEILRREEASWRGPYAGTVAFLRPGRQATFALAIRSAFASGPRLYTAAGAGIVHRSSPAREFHETLAKLSAVESALLGEAS